MTPKEYCIVFCEGYFYAKFDEKVSIKQRLYESGKLR